MRNIFNRRLSVKLQIWSALLGNWRSLPLLFGFLKGFHFFLVGFKLVHFGLFISRPLCKLLLKSNWVEWHLMPDHTHSTCSTWLLPSSTTLWPLDLLMDFLESRKPLLYAHGCWFSCLLLLELSPLIRSHWCALLCLHHGRPVRLLSDVSHHWDPETTSTSSGSCAQATQGNASWGFLEVS